MGLRRILLVLLACGMTAFDSPPPPSPAAAAYLDQAIALIRANHYKAAGADWPAVTARAHAAIAGAATPADTYPAIRGVLQALGERHSFLIEAAQARAPAPTPQAAAASEGVLPTWELARGRFGIVRLPELNTSRPGGPTLGSAYAAALRTGLETMDKAPLCGWVVDLRKDGGGNMWPMLQGLDPLLGPAPFGAFLQQAKVAQVWTRTPQGIFPAPAVVPGTGPAFTLKHGAAPVAVLIGPKTASSGEMTAAALIGRARVRGFGAASAGFTTGNGSFPLSDGAILVITGVTIRDRTGRDYTGPIQPDALAADAEQAAEAWLADQCAAPRLTMPPPA